jgi:hypothetical protein
VESGEFAAAVFPSRDETGFVRVSRVIFQLNQLGSRGGECVLLRNI